MGANLKAKAIVEAAIRRLKAVEPFSFDRIYGAFLDMLIENDAKESVKRSAKKYPKAIQGST